MGWLVHVCGIASGRRELHVPNIDVQRSELPDNLHMQSPASEALPNLARHRDNTESTLGCPVDVECSDIIIWVIVSSFSRELG
jgi:hypothetical protein